MTFETQRDKALAVLAESGIWPSNYAPLLLKLLWKLGLKVPPPHFVRFWHVAVVYGVWFACTWGLLMWCALWMRQGMPIAVAITSAGCAGALFGISMAAYYAYGRRKYRLPTWASLVGCDPEQAEGCFPAGTCVHTDHGLVPIEKLKAGDMVLSSPEQGGEQAYKRVVKAYAYDDKTLRSILYCNEETGQQAFIYATGNHPFWVVEEQGYLGDEGEWVSQQHVRGWTQAEDLVPDGQRLDVLVDGTKLAAWQDARHHHLVRLADGGMARIIANVPVYRTNTPNCGWVRMPGQSPFEPDNGVVGAVRNFVSGDIVENGVYLTEEIYSGEAPYLKTRVFNIDIEGFHTFYVDYFGIWVGAVAHRAP